MDGKHRFYATCDGSVKLSGDKEVVNIETRGDVAISRLVLYGFAIKYGGTLVIGGEAETERQNRCGEGEEGGET